MKKCASCQKENPDDSTFCAYCGRAFTPQVVPPLQQEQRPSKKKVNPLLYVAIGVFALIGLSVLLSLFSAWQEEVGQPNTKRPATQQSNQSQNLSTLHRSMIGHWIEYGSHMHAYISSDAIVLKKEDEPRLESYTYRVYSEDNFLKTLLLKVKQSGDLSEDSWEAQVVDYGQGVRLTIGRAQFSYVDSRTRP